MATPFDVEPRTRKLAWVFFILLMLLFAGYVGYVISARVADRRNPPVSVEFIKDRNHLRLPGFLAFYFPLNQRVTITPPDFLVAPNDASSDAPSTLNITCVANTSRVGRWIARGRYEDLPPADVTEASVPLATGTIRVLTMHPAFFRCRALEGGTYEACKAAHGANLVAGEIPYAVRGNCNVTVSQAADIADLKHYWNTLGSKRNYEVVDEIPGPVMISFDTHHLYLNMSAKDSDSKTPYLAMGIQGLFFTSTSVLNRSDMAFANQYLSLERGATYVMHYPKGESGLGSGFTISQPDISGWSSLSNRTVYNYDQFSVDPFRLASSYIFNGETRGIFNTVGPTFSPGFLEDGSMEELVITKDQERQQYQLPGPISGVSMLPSQFIPLNTRGLSFKEPDAIDEETRWIATPSGFRPVGREFTMGLINPFRSTHPVNLGLYNDPRGIQVSRQVDPISPTVIYTILFTGLSTVLAIFNFAFMMRPEYSELILWPVLEAAIDKITFKRPSHARTESAINLRTDAKNTSTGDGL